MNPFLLLKELLVSLSCQSMRVRKEWGWDELNLKWALSWTLKTRVDKWEGKQKWCISWMGPHRSRFFEDFFHNILIFCNWLESFYGKSKGLKGLFFPPQPFGEYVMRINSIWSLCNEWISFVLPVIFFYLGIFVKVETT